MEVHTVADFISSSEKEDSACLVDQHSTMLFRFCRGLTYSKEDAEDLFQETWVTLLKKPNKLASTANPQALLCQVALYLWKSQQRKYARRNRIAPTSPLSFDLPSTQNLEQALLNQAEKEFVQHLVNQLPDKYRIVLILYYTLEMDIAAIAKTLKLPAGTVKSRLFTARKEIKKGWQTYESE